MSEFFRYAAWIGTHVMVYLIALVMLAKKHSFLATVLVCLAYYMIMKWSLRM